ncbi:MAG: VOC family protein, partial [Mogibacterium sp.]|nr:VOC family protein [Mogibacterium sp.]
MAITKTIRPGLIQLRVTDLEASAKFYEEVLGLDVVGKTSDGRVM